MVEFLAGLQHPTKYQMGDWHGERGLQLWQHIHQCAPKVVEADTQQAHLGWRLLLHSRFDLRVASRQLEILITDNPM